MKLEKSKFCFIIIGLITLTIGVFAFYLLPEKYLYDALLIYNDPYNEKGYVGSYPVSMWFYDFFMLNKLPFPLIAVIQISIIFWLFFKQGIPKNFNKLYFSNVLIWFSLLAIAAYISIPSKEFINILFAFVVVYFLRKKLKQTKTGIFFVFLLFFLYGFWFRPYYLLVPIIAIASFFISKIKSIHKTTNIIISTILIAVFMSLSYGLIEGEFMSQSTREALNEKRLGREDSQTLILSPIKTDSFIGESIGIIYGYFSESNSYFLILFIFFIIILFTHKQNIVRLKNSEENKIKL